MWLIVVLAIGLAIRGAAFTENPNKARCCISLQLMKNWLYDITSSD